MISPLQFFFHLFLRPLMIGYVVVLWGFMAGLAFVMTSVRGFGRSENIEVYMKQHFDRYLEAWLIFAWTAGTWMFLFTIGKHLRTRSCAYTVPVGRCQWLRWNMGFLAMSLAACGVLKWNGSTLALLPLLVAGLLSVIETISRCLLLPRPLEMLNSLATIVLLGAMAFFLEELSALAIAEPHSVSIAACVACIAIPLLFARIAIRRWREGYTRDRNASFNTLGLRHLFEPLETARLRHRETLNLNSSASSISQASHHALLIFFPAVRWDRFSMPRIFLRRLGLGIAMLAFLISAMFLLELQDDGYTEAINRLSNRAALDISFFPMLVMMFFSPHLESGTRWPLHHELLGRRGSAQVLNQICLRLGWLVALPTLAAFLVVELVLCLYLGQAWSWPYTAALVGQFLLTLSILPLALAWMIDKWQASLVSIAYARIGKMLATMVVLVFVPVAYDNLLLDDFKAAMRTSDTAYVAGQLITVSGLLIALVLISRLALRRYLGCFYDNQQLVKR